MLEESVIYQDIYQKGHVSGKQEGASEVALFLAEQRLGHLSRNVQRQIKQLMTEQIKALCGAIKEFKTKQDLTQWLKQHTKQRR